MSAFRRPQQNASLSRAIAWSTAVHVVALAVVSVTFSHAHRAAPQQVIQVKLVGVPQPTPRVQQQKPPEEVRTQDSAAPKEPPPETKEMPESDARTKMVTEPKEVVKEKENPIEAKKRPPVLDKTPREKKVVKNKKDAKVVKNPEDFMAALEFIDKLKTQNITPSATTPPDPKKQAGEGPQIQLNLTQQGEADAIRAHIYKSWTKPTGVRTEGLMALIRVRLDEGGNITGLQLLESSGQTAYDNSAMRAIQKSVPIPIPAGEYDTFKELEVYFDGNEGQ